MLDLNKIGRKIIELRKLNNMTQDDVAKKLFISRQLISKWENGSGLPTIEMLLDLCDILNTTFDEILCLEKDEGRNENDLKEN